MTTYPADQVGAVADPAAREILTQRGIPDTPAVGFRSAKALGPVAKDPSCLQLGEFGVPGAPVGLARDGTVVSFSPWSDTGSSLVNTNLQSFVDSLDVIAEYGPFSDDPDVAEESARRLRPALQRVDPAALADTEGVWYNVLDEIAAGMYSS